MSGPRVALVAEDQRLAQALAARFRSSLDTPPLTCDPQSVRAHLSRDGDGLLVLAAATAAQAEPLIRLVQEIFLCQWPPLLFLEHAPLPTLASAMPAMVVPCTGTKYEKNRHDCEGTRRAASPLLRHREVWVADPFPGFGDDVAGCGSGLFKRIEDRNVFEEDVFRSSSVGEFAQTFHSAFHAALGAEDEGYVEGADIENRFVHFVFDDLKVFEEFAADG